MTAIKILRLQVVAQPKAPNGSAEQGWTISYLPVLSTGEVQTPLPAGWPDTRQVGVQEYDDRLFPRLPEGDTYTPPVGIPPGVSQRVKSYCEGQEPEALNDLYDSIIRRKPVEANFDVSTWGRYLFETLIGQATWEQVRTWAVANAADILEVALDWGVGETHLHRLNWEMMHSPGAFLAAYQADPPHQVVITRMVQQAAAQPEKIKETPRFLFVLGAPPTDRGIRAGAELIGVLRSIEAQSHPFHPRVLAGAEDRGATPRDLESALASFAPHVVHFTCHGKFDDGGGAALVLQPNNDDPLQKKDFDTQAIYNFLSQDPILPRIVVLSACNTGQSGEAEGGELLPVKGGYETAPMAAGLVQRGIPIVVGMAGEVADSACRYFTRRFGETLVAGEPLVSAVAEGRFAAFAYSQSVEASVDWGFPALFVSEKVPPGFIPLETDGNPEYTRVETWIQNYSLRRPPTDAPVYCGRDDYFAVFYRLLETAPPSVMAAFVTEGKGYGKSRLLEELAMSAIRDGQIPVPLIHTANTNTTYPKDLQGLRAALALKMGRVAEIYTAADPKGLPPRPKWKLFDLKPGPDGRIDPEKPGLPAGVYDELMESDGDLTGRALALALRSDLLSLRDYVRAHQPYVHERGGIPVLLLDDVHKFGLEFIGSWFSGDVLAGYGLGIDSDDRIPVVMTLSLDGDGGPAARQIIEPLRQKGHTLGWLHLKELGKFPQEKDRDFMLYQRIWLNPFNPDLYPESSNIPLAISPDLTKGDKWKPWVDGVRASASFPYQFTQPMFYIMAAMGLQDHFLQPADDRQMLQEYKKKFSDAED